MANKTINEDFDFYKVDNNIKLNNPIRQLPENEILFYLKDFDLKYRISLIKKNNDFVLGEISILEEILKRMGQRNEIENIKYLAHTGNFENNLLYKKKRPFFKRIIFKAIELFNAKRK